MISKLGYRVDVILEDGGLFASSPVYTDPPFSGVDDALVGAESFVAFMRLRGIGAEARVSIVKIEGRGQGGNPPQRTDRAQRGRPLGRVDAGLSGWQARLVARD